MEVAMPAQGGMVAVMRRELARFLATPRLWVLGIFVPVLLAALLVGVLHRQTPTDLAVAILDEDHSALSRQLARAVGATRSVRLAMPVASVSEGEARMRSERLFAVLAIPRNFQRDVLRGMPARVELLYNTQMMTAGNIVARDIRTAAGTLSAGVGLQRGSAPALTVESHALFNPGLDYMRFLGLPLIVAVFHIAMVVVAVDVAGRELRESTAREWLATAGGQVGAALVGKSLPYIMGYALAGWLGLAGLVRVFGIAPAVAQWVWFAAWSLMVLASFGFGLFLAGALSNLRMAVSTASLVVSPAFAFSGMTFPVMAMHGVAKAWALTLPLGHFLAVQTAVLQTGASARTLWPHLLVLTGFSLLPWLLLRRWRRVMIDPACWGRT